MTLEYLNEYQNNVDLNRLIEIKKERDLWWDRESNLDYLNALKSLPEVHTKSFNYSQAAVTIGDSSEISEEEKKQIIDSMQSMLPWRKGPFNLFGIELDAEWRSDFKWERLKNSISSLEGKKILDIGCNNGYFMFRMLEQNPELVIGIDPMTACDAQFQVMNKYANSSKLHFELFGVEHLDCFKGLFDTIFSMGIIYHHRHPIQQLIDIREALVPGGEAILETIGIPGEESYALFPEDRYAKMRNVWFIPTLSCFINWAKKAKFIDVEVIAATPLTDEEQRNTPWCPAPFQSLNDFIDPEDPTKTVEGHPAPMRFCIKAKRR
ncbi:MAG: tRNA 5-methoxyuridine(34)/uridine 5-oxyacetic acid(34) synthase CmoB [Bacteriovoracaceae bacterium]|nr:tRNA 5-methoxyuridine(34)/uridine 5-oxyacetic acid(34) synthase CmoB [Bacteriovoracaceae bacterium]